MNSIHGAKMCFQELKGKESCGDSMYIQYCILYRSAKGFYISAFFSWETAEMDTAAASK